MSEKFYLKWNDFESTVSNSFGILRQEKDFFDVTLVSDDEMQIPAHRLVLSACSEFFKLILRKNSHSHPLLYLSGINSTNLSQILYLPRRSSDFSRTSEQFSRGGSEAED